MEWSASSPDLNPAEHLWDQPRRALHARVTNTTMLANVALRMGCHPSVVCGQAGDQHEVDVPGYCGCVWFFHTS